MFKNGGKNSSHSANNSKNQTTSPRKKKKTPSRRRRDRERFLRFLDRKKQRKAQNDQLSQSSVCSLPVSQCAPPVDAIITVPDPPTVTISAPTVTPALRGSEAAIPNAVPSVTDHPCICYCCTEFEDVDPHKRFYPACGYCSKPWTDNSPLKPCSQCLSRAYCNRECQKSAWAAGHKHECNKVLGDSVRMLGTRDSWLRCKDIWLKQKIEPVLQPPT